MKGKFTKIMAALALLVGLTIPMGMWGQSTYTKVTTAQSDWSGTYVIVADASNVIFTGQDGTNTYGGYASVEISNNEVTGDYSAYEVEIEQSGDHYSIKHISSSKYLGWTSGNSLAFSTDAPTADSYRWVLSASSILNVNDNSRKLQYNSGSPRFACYTSSQKVAYLYKKEAGGTSTFTVTYDANGGTGTMTDPNSPYEEGDEVTLLDNTFVAPEGMMWNSWLVKDAGNNTISVTNNHFTMPASNVTVTAQWINDPSAPTYEWALTDLADLTSSDVFVIVGNNGSNFAMANDGGATSAPSAVAVTVANNKITTTVANNIKWNISGNAEDGYVFYPNGSTETWLYCTGDNNGVRVGTTSSNNYNKFKLQENYIYNIGRSAYLGVYQSQDWRRYTTINANIQNQSFAFYKRQVVSTDPAIYASNVNIAYNDLEGQIEYTLENEVTGGELTATTTSDWLTLPQTFASPITFTATENTMTEARTATVTLTYTYGNNQSIFKDVTVTQGAHPVTYTTIEALFDAAGNTATEVFVTFGGWVVSGVSTNGYNVFVTDGTNGFVINGGDHGFVVGNTLTSTTPITCTLQKSNGYAKVTGVNASTEGLTVGTGGTITEADIEMANLTGINTSALVSYENLTCSVDNNKYYLTDGTTTIQAYNTLYAFDEFEDGKTYNITGVYQQYNSTKEILPRSAEDIVEVQIQHDEYTLTVGNPDHITFTVNYDEEVLENGETAEVQDGTEIAFTVVVENGYVLENVTVVGANQELVSFTETSGVYTFDMPAFDVTINAMAVALNGDQYELYTGAIVEGDYLIVYDEDAMKSTVSNSRLQYESVTVTNDVITTDNAAIVWHIAPSGDYWTIYNVDANAYAASTGTKNQAQMLADGTDDKALWTVSGTETYEFVNKQNTTNEVNANLRKNGTYGFACYATSTGGALSLYKKVEATPDTETCTLTINGYTDAESKAGYYLIASPVTVNIADVAGLTEGDYDLYSYDESQELEWINYKQEDGSHPFTTLEPGKGYLYAKKATAETSTYTFTLTGTPYYGTPIVLSKQSTGTLAGWNLIGNPLATSNIAPGRAFYIMNSTIGELIASESNTVEPMQGFFVIADEDGEEFELTVPLGGDGNLDKLVMNLSQNRGTVIDRAIVRFDEGGQLPKFQLFESSTKLYIPQGNSDYAIVRSAAEGEMPVNFKAKENGTYTISVNTENVEMDYLHLIDNMTGADVDLLATPSYTFEATSRDYASRFRLTFSANETDGPSTGSGAFAYFNGSEWQISNIGEATLQVIDVTGRIVKNVALEGNATVSINETPGVYMMRLLNGNDVKVQKVVIR